MHLVTCVKACGRPLRVLDCQLEAVAGDKEGSYRWYLNLVRQGTIQKDLKRFPDHPETPPGNGAKRGRATRDGQREQGE